MRRDRPAVPTRSLALDSPTALTTVTPVSTALRIAALGGLGEVGMNCLTLEVNGRILVIDCGLTFPTYEPGVDVIHADFEWLRERREDVEAIVLTHGHEDHVGAVPYLLDDVDAPIYGPSYAIELVKERLTEIEVECEPRLNVFEAGDRITLGDFDVEAYHVPHSIPQACGLILRTPAGTVVHSGDFRFDEHPLDGRPLDVNALARARDEGGIDLLMSDSTNAQVAGTAGSETPVVEALQARIAQAPQRLVIALFASNAHRVLGLLRAAKQHNRRVLALGRSLTTHLAIAERTGLPVEDLPPLVRPEEAQSVPRSELLVLVTGSQGEPLAALPRLARGEHHALKLDAGDEVILSSRIIPGREIPVHTMIDRLERMGVRVWNWHDDRGLHASGHACRDEQQRLIELIRPRAFLPLHGGYAQLKRHAELARELDVPHGIVAENGKVRANLSTKSGRSGVTKAL